MSLIRRSALSFTKKLVNGSTSYSSNFAVGVPFEIPGATLDSGNFSKIRSLTVINSANAGTEFYLILFSSKPAQTIADHATYNPNLATNLLTTAVIHCINDWFPFATGAARTFTDDFAESGFSSLLQSLTDPLNPGKVGSLWGLYVTRNALTISGELTIKIGLEHL